MQQQRVGNAVLLQQMMALSTHPFVIRKEKRKKRKIQKQFLVPDT